MNLESELYQSFGFRIRRMLIMTILTGFTVVTCTTQARTQTSTSSSILTQYVPTKAFDVISVREARPDAVKGFRVGGGFAGNSSALTMTNVSIEYLLTMAYGLSEHQISGLPNWTSEPMYNVEAKSDEETNKELANLSADRVALEHQHMLQVLLADRFNLKVHWEARKRRIFNLVVARSSPKLLAGGSQPPSEDELKPFGNNKMPEIHQRGDGVLGYEFVGHDAHIAKLAAILGSLIQTDVNDTTGLTGTYDFDLQYSEADDVKREADPKIWPPILEAVEEQLGLKLVRATGEVKMLVVDHIEHPSPN